MTTSFRHIGGNVDYSARLIKLHIVINLTAYKFVILGFSYSTVCAVLKN